MKTSNPKKDLRCKSLQVFWVRLERLRESAWRRQEEKHEKRKKFWRKNIDIAVYIQYNNRAKAI